MEKLTNKYKESILRRVYEDSSFQLTIADQISEVINKLDEYEDTGLEPEEVVRVKIACEGHFEAYQEAREKLSEYEDLEEQGRLIKLPCKVGDIVYCTPFEIEFDNNSIVPGKLTGVITEEQFQISFYEDLGKYVFLTREEAEAKLKEVQNG